MKLLSIDVGIKNLAFCLFRVPDTDSSNSKQINQSSQFEILIWDVVGISQSEEQEVASFQRAESHPLCCHHHAKTNTQCKLKAVYFYYSHLNDEPIFTCKRHAQPSSTGAKFKQVIDMTPPQIAKLLKSGSNDRLLGFCDSFKTHSAGECEEDEKCNPEPSDPKPKHIKTELIERATHLLKTSCLFQYEHSHTYCVSNTTELLTTGYIIKKLTASKTTEKDISAADTVSLISVGYNLMQKFDKLFYSENSDGQCYNPDRVVIENQISPIATRMKTVQGMVTQYFLMRGVSKTNISYISATNKLKAWSAINAGAEIDTYDNRKKTGIACVRTILSPAPSTLNVTTGTDSGIGMSDADILRWRTAFESHKKKDDMADSLLQGISCL